MRRQEPNPLVVLVVIAFIIAACARRKWHGSGTSHGTAAWATKAQLRRAGMLSGRGLVLGRTRRGKLIWLPRYCHLLLIGGTGSGKGVSVIIPQLLTYQGAIICFDVKGDLYAITAARRQRMGHRILDLAPFGGGKDKWNILDSVLPGPMLVDQARAIAEAIVVRQGTEPDPHWNESAVMVICGLLVFVLLHLEGKERSLNSLRDIASDPGLVQAAADKLVQLGGVPGRFGNHLLGLHEKERSGIMSTVARHLAFLDSELVAAAVSESTFDPRQLCGSGTPITLYIRIPPDQLEAQRGLLRCWTSTLIRIIGTFGDETTGEVLALMDEASALGSLPALEEALVRGRSAGVRMLLAYQSDSQARIAFRDKPTLLYDNCDAQIYLGGANSYETAERISKMLGEATIEVESAGENESRSTSQGGPPSEQVSRSWSRNWAEQGRPLLKPEEVLTMNTDYLIAFVRGVNPIFAKRIKWYADPAFGSFRSRKRTMWWLMLSASIGAIAWTVLRSFGH